MFAVPAEVSKCVRVDKVEFSCRNSHSYDGTGVTQYLAITHTMAAGATWPGSTGVFGGRFTNKGGWYGGSEWVDITADKEPTFNADRRGELQDEGRMRHLPGLPRTAPSATTRTGRRAPGSASPTRLRRTSRRRHAMARTRINLNLYAGDRHTRRRSR